MVRRILIVTAVEAERAAFERGLAELGRLVEGSERARVGWTVLAGGVGTAAVAAATAATLARAECEGASYDLVVSAGIGGAFAETGRIGDLLVAERIVAADLGADSAEGFLSVEELGFGTTTYAATALDQLKVGAVGGDVEFGVVRGDLLTVNTVTGTAERAAWLRNRHPNAVGEAMEGYGVAAAAARFGLPVAEVRAVSNLIGPRDRDAWRIGEALAVLGAAAAPVVECIVEGLVR